MCYLNTDMFREIENDLLISINNLNLYDILYIDWMYFINIFLEMSLFPTEIYEKYVTPIVKPFMEKHINPLIYGDLEKLYPNIDSLIYNISYNDGKKIVLDMTDYYNEIFLTKIRDNYGKTDLITYEEMLIRYYTHNEMFDDLMIIENISKCYITITYNNIVRLSY